MQLQFDANQDFQIEAINAIADLFAGQRRHEVGFTFEFGTIPAIPNRIDLAETDILRNLQAVQKRNFDPRQEDSEYVGDDKLQYLVGEVVTVSGRQETRFA